VTAERPSSPSARLLTRDVVAIIVGVVVGVGIFRAPSVVASGVDSDLGFLAVWVLGGLLSIAGALCYGELVAAYPNTGGEYSFLRRAFGDNVAFMFAWARLTVIGTGSIALLAFVFGDHMVAIAPLGEHGSAIYGAAIVVALVTLNLLGIHQGTSLQKILSTLLVVALVLMAGAALAFGGASEPAAAPSAATTTVGLAMVFVLLTYGGWNEAAYLSAEVRGGPRRMAWTIVGAVGAVAVLYVAINFAYVRVLGLSGLRGAATPGADLMTVVAGPIGGHLVSALVAAAALTSMNATLITMSRTAYAFGEDVHLARWLGRWNARAGAPIAALLALGGLTLALVLVGALARRGFATMVEYTAPVFWTFFLLTGLSLFVLRAREPHVPRPFRVPLYPLTPIVFCATCAWLLHASLAYTQVGAVVGVGLLALGLLPLALERRARRTRIKELWHEPSAAT
jgi:basic amino acid/polyamine antiporter, APA family